MASRAFSSNSSTLPCTMETSALGAGASAVSEFPDVAPALPSVGAAAGAAVGVFACGALDGAPAPPLPRVKNQAAPPAIERSHHRDRDQRQAAAADWPSRL